MKIYFSPIIESEALEIARWRYPPPYDIYDLSESEEAISYVLDPQNRFYAMKDNQGELVGFCSFGKDGQVPGGDYGVDAMDIGLGIRPDLVGQGRGIEYVRCVIQFAEEKFDNPQLRVTIAAFNQRAQQLWKKAGFLIVEKFQQEGTERRFVVMFGPVTKKK